MQINPVKILPPDEQQREFAQEVQQGLPSEAKVSFFRIETQHNTKRYGVIYQYGSARHSSISDVPHYDSDEMVRAVTHWIASLHGSVHRWRIGVEN